VPVQANHFLLYPSFTGKLSKYEVPTAITLCKEVWSPEMGLVTAAFKLKRKDIQDKYKSEITRMYAS
jgi:long-chain acyl-CoA synthetase